MIRFLRTLPPVLALLAVCAFGAASADEGLWTFDNFPADKVKARYGVTIDQAWLDHVRGATLRLNTGCSASIVSGQGLVLTNHHCISDCAQNLSTPTDDKLKNGVLTASMREERTCPGMQAEQLETITDVTATVQGALSGKTGEALVRARAAAISGLEAEGCGARQATHVCEVVSLYQGGQYRLYVFRKYSDVRLVFAPELQTAFFGGDPDNFNFPRYDLDVSFLRLYEDGRPAPTPEHLRWSAQAPKAGEPVFVPGNPGSTNRLLTVAQLKTLRDVALPQVLLQFSELRGQLIQFGDASPEAARTASHELFTIENSFKAYYGQLQALSTPGFLEAKQADEDALKAKALANRALRSRLGDPWKEIAAVQPDRAALNARYSLLESRAGFYSDLFAYARTLVRAAAERAKPSAERLPEYGDARLPVLAKTLLDAKPVAPALDQLELAFWLTKTREYLTADSPDVVALLGRDSPDSLAARLSASRLGDPALRKALFDGGQAAIDASSDPLIRFVAATDAGARDARRDYEAKVGGPTARAASRVAEARFAVLGTSVYPDATFSPRLSYGAVAGWTYQGRDIAPFTTFKGLWTRATDKPPFDLAPRWQAARSKLNDDTVFDVSTTNDIIGGNSGSPLINARAEVIGAVFDGNIHSLGGAFAYDGALNRTVAVSTAAATEALKAVYGREALVSELLAP
jgi:hypothetical protein